MSDTNGVGPSFAEAAQEALAEEADSAESPASDSEVSDSLADAAGQSTVENEESIFQTLKPKDEDAGNNVVGDSTVVDFNGEKLTIGELKNGYLRQSDATKKWQEAADLRNKAESALTLWDALEKDPAGTLRQLQSRVGRQPIQETFKAEKPGVNEDDIDARVEARVKEILGDDPAFKQFKYDNALRALNHVFSEIEGEYDLSLSDEDREFVINEARRTGTNDLKYVFWQLYRQVESKDKQRSNAKANSSVDGFRGDIDTPDDRIEEVPETFKEAAEAAMRELKLEEIT